MGSEKRNLEPLHGTTSKAYRFIYRQGHPVGEHEIQRGLGLASPSTPHYHLEKLRQNGLVREEGHGYVVDRVFLDNFVRIRRTAIPLQAALAAFFATSSWEGEQRSSYAQLVQPRRYFILEGRTWWPRFRSTRQARCQDLNHQSSGSTSEWQDSPTGYGRGA